MTDIREIAKELLKKQGWEPSKVEQNLRHKFPDNFSEDNINLLYRRKNENDLTQVLDTAVEELVDFDTQREEIIDLGFITFDSSFNFQNLFSKIMNSKGVSFDFARIKKKFDLSGCSLKIPISFKETNFSEAAIFKHCTMEEPFEFCSSIFEATADFEGLLVKKEIVFDDVRFRSGTSFKSLVCNQEIDFKNNIFNQEADFSEVRFNERVSFIDNDFQGGVNIDESVFNAQYPPLFQFKDKDCTLKASNRESAKRIKHFMQQSGDVIGSNKWYAVEME